MDVLGTLGIVAGLVVIALMAAGPALVDLNERFPLRERDDSGAEQDRRSLDLRWSGKDPNSGLNRNPATRATEQAVTVTDSRCRGTATAPASAARSGATSIRPRFTAS